MEHAALPTPESALPATPSALLGNAAIRIGAGPARGKLDSAVHARPRLMLVLLCLALWLPGFFNLPPTDRDESRFAQATKQMLETGDFVRIMNGAEARNRKPIGIYWLQAPFAAAARAAGIATANPIWPYRLPSLLGALAAVLATYSLGLTLLADRRAALLAAAMLASCTLLSVEAHLAKTDAAVLGATTVAISVLARAWAGQRPRAPQAALFWIALGAGILIKGPIAPLVVGATALAASLRAGGGWLSTLRPRWGLPLLLAMVLPWFIAIGIATHGAFFRDSIGGDLGSKLAGGAETHGAPPGFHLLLLPLLTFPATIPVICGLYAAWGHRHETGTRFLLCWLLPSWLVLEAVPTKLPHYTLPLYPAVFLLAAAWLCRPVAPRWLSLTALSLTALVALAIGGSAALAPAVLHCAWWIGLPALVGAAVALRFAARLNMPAAILCAVPLYAAIMQLEVPALTPLWLAPQLTAILRAGAPAIGPDGAGLVAGGYAEPSLMFLAGTHLALMPNGEATAREVQRIHGGAAIVADRDVPDFLAASRRRRLAVTRIGHADGMNAAHGKPIGLDVFTATPAAPARKPPPAPP
jgi:4-amino-4-deoxy-L-arabinose transferase-like glycosyltransferase